MSLQYLQQLRIQYLLYFIHYPLYLFKDCQSRISILNKKREFTDIDSNENINLL